MENQAKNITEVFLSGIWKGKTCFILGGGPSLKDFDFKLIENYPTIGVNKTFTKFLCTINYSMDPRFYEMLIHPQTEEARELQQQWLQYQGITVFLRRTRCLIYNSTVYYVNQLDGRFAQETRRNRLREVCNRNIVSISSSEISFDLEAGILGGNNSGFGALMLAIALGSTRIGLLGFDLKVQREAGKIRTHFHKGYSFQNPNTFQNKLDRFITCFERYAPMIKEAGVEVINLNPDSALTCFPKMSIDEFME